MNHMYTFAALDIARERVREAEQARLASIASRRADRARGGIVRRGLASGFAMLSRGSASAARRLDDHVASGLDQALAAK
jgi:hypothetical protein